MSDSLLKLVLGGALLLHGLGHGGAFGALVWIWARPGTDTGGWTAARSWLLPALPASTASTVASAFWILALVGFVAAALAFTGVLPGEAWRPLAAASALVSLVGIMAFAGTWPAFNTVAALGVNVAVLVALVGLHWPPETLVDH